MLPSISEISKTFSVDGHRFVDITHVFDDLPNAFLAAIATSRIEATWLLFDAEAKNACHVKIMPFFTTSPALESQLGGQIRIIIIFV